MVKVSVARLLFPSDDPAALPRSAVRHLQDAAAREPNSAETQARLAVCYVSLCVNAVRPGPEMMPLALHVARHAISLDQRQAAAHGALGAAYSLGALNLVAGEAALREAIRLAPTWAIAPALLAMQASAQGRADVALDMGSRALVLAPTSASIHCAVGEAWHWLGFDEQSERAIETALRLAPTMSVAKRVQSVQLWRRDLPREACHAVAIALAMGRRHPMLVGTYGLIHGLAGVRGPAEDSCEELLARSRSEYIGPLPLADALLGVGDIAAALSCFEQARDEQSGLLLRLTAPIYAALRRHSRFRKILALARLPV